MTSEIKLPDIAEVLRQALQKVEPALRPLLLAALERLAARRYRAWADEHLDPAVKEGLLACAEREEEIARRVESLEPNAAAIQNKLLSENPELLDLNRTLFEGRPLKEQFAMQAQGERAGAAVWKAYAAAAADPPDRELLQSCSPLEEANADFLQALL
ncbi:MAG: hypothetical protein ACREEM_32150 [Blastocatellia bacterium]